MADCPFEILNARLQAGTCKALVAEACQQWPSCKGNYGLLYFRVSQLLGIKNLRDYFAAIERGRAYSPETIGRRYRELAQAEPEKFKPSLGTQKKRVKNERVFREFYSSRAGPVLGAWF